MKLNRFERKILAAIVVATVMPLVGALVLGRAALREAYAVGVNVNVRAQLERGLGMYRQHFTTLRSHASEVAVAIAYDHPLHASYAGPEAERAGQLESRLRDLLTEYKEVAAIEVLAGNGVVLARAADPTRAGQHLRPLELTQPLGAEPHAQVRVTVAAPAQAFLDYQRDGELVEVYRRLEKGKGEVAAFYLVVYMAFLLSVIVIALAVGIVLSRRVTQRVALLAAATRRLGAGELDVQVPTDVNDEIGELTRSWNDMVRDMTQARGRIEYLQRISAWQEFARRLAHEIKNPLTPIQLAIQEVSRGYSGSEPEHKQRLEDARSIIEEEVATLRRLTSEFSTFAKLPQATLAPADLNDFVRDASRSFDALVEEHKPREGTGTLEVVTHCDKRALPVRIDAMMLKRALDNLVRNALQALREHPQVSDSRVVVRTLREGKFAVLEIADNGPGVPERDRGRVFDPYFTTKSEGTGLGLPIVKKVVLEHHGEIACGDSDQGGASFRIKLPLGR
jgi:two-component system, NtrC family, nitrogen regulation sensor histidine kinase NtrY